MGVRRKNIFSGEGFFWKFLGFEIYYFWSFCSGEIGCVGIVVGKYYSGLRSVGVLRLLVEIRL